MESPALALLVFLGNSCSRWGCLAGGWGSALPLKPPADQGLLVPRLPSCLAHPWPLPPFLVRDFAVEAPRPPACVSRRGCFHFYSRSKCGPRGSCCHLHQGLGVLQAALPASALIAVTQGAGSSLGGCIVTDDQGQWTGPGANMGPGGRRARPLLVGRASGGYLMTGLGAGLDPWPRRGLPGLAQAPVPRPWVAAALLLPLPDSILWPGVACSLQLHPQVGRHGPPPVTFQPCLGLVSQDSRLSEHEHPWEDPGV